MRLKIPCISQSLFILSILLYASNANAEISCPASDITDTTISGNMRGLDVSDTDCSVLDHNVSDYNSAATFPTSIFPFSAFLPDLSSGQTVARFAMHTGSTIATFSSATCSGATITGIDTLVLDVELNNGDSCTLKFGANSDDQGFSGATLSRSGSIYSLTAGTLSGGPYGGTFVVADSTPPTLSTLSPADNATDISTTANLVITLSENAAKGTGNILIKKTADDSTAETIDVTSGLVTISGAVVTINPSITLDSNTEYYVQIAATALDDSSGNSYAGITDTTSWSFRTSASYSISIAKTTDGTENNGSTPTDAVFTVTVTPANASGSAITGNIAYTGTATNGTDYATGATTFSIPNNSSTATITLDVTEDAIVEGTETVIATISSPSEGSIATAAATANLTDDDNVANAAPVITEGDSASVRVGTDSQTPAFNLTLNATDTNTADTLTWSIKTNGSKGTASVSGTGASKTIGYTLNSGAVAGSESFVVEVSDGALTDTITVNVFILDTTLQPASDADSNNDGITDGVAASFGTTDSDNDSIPDALETLLDRDVTPTTDTDGDGMPDVAEVLTGRDPNSNDNATTGSPVITVATSPLNLAAKGTVSVYSLTELGVSATDNGVAVTPVPYLKNGVCATGVPYNYKVVCNAIPASGVVSGSNEVWWLFTDTARNWGRNEQFINVLPQIAFQRDRVLAGAANQGSLTTKLVLSGNTVLGQAFNVPFTVSGTAQNPNDADLVAGQFQFQANQRESDPITVTLGSNPTNGNTFVLTLDSSSTIFSQTGASIDTAKVVTVGEKVSQTLTISQGQLYPPRIVNLKGTQGSGGNAVTGQLFDKTQGNVTLNFGLIDPDGGTYSYSWANSDSALLATGLISSTDQNPVLDLSGLATGRYFIELQVTDSTANNATTRLGFMLSVVSISLSPTDDSDGDGTTDSAEGLGDDDGDGIPNYLDAQDAQANVVPTKSADKKNFLVKANPGLRILFGLTAIAVEEGDVTIGLADIASNGNNGQATSNSALPNTVVSQVFDYEIEGFDVPFDPNASGNSIAIILPLTTALTADTSFNKYNATDGWKAFVEDADNTIQWAAFEDGVEGNCPESDSSAYSGDLSEKAGKTCLKVTLEDGGSNDADGAVNGRIVDPLSVGEATATTPTITAHSGGGGLLDWFVGLLLLFIGILKQGLQRMRRQEAETCKS